MNSSPTPTLSSTIATTYFDFWVKRVRMICSTVVSALFGNLVSTLLAFFLVVVGSMLGAITGALKGRESKNVLFRGFVVGFISGAFLSIHVFEHSLLLWQSGNTEIMCLQYIVDVITSLLSGRSIPGQIGHIFTMLSPVQNHLHTRSSFDEVPDVFEIEGSKGLSEDLVEKISKITIILKNNVDASREEVSCCVCLQDFHVGETNFYAKSMVTTMNQSRESRIRRKMEELCIRYSGYQPLYFLIPIPVSPTYHRMSYEEVMKVGDDYYQMAQFYYLLTFEVERQNGFRLLAKEAIITKNEAADVRPRESRRYPASSICVLNVVFPPSKYVVSSSSEETLSSGREDECSIMEETVNSVEISIEGGEPSKIEEVIERKDISEKEKVLIIYPDGVDVGKEYLKYKKKLQGKWGSYVEEQGLWFRAYIPGKGEEANGVMNVLQCCPAQLNGNVYEMMRKYVEGRSSGYLYSVSARPKFFDFESAGRPWNDYLVGKKYLEKRSQEFGALTMKFKVQSAHMKEFEDQSTRVKELEAELRQEKEKRAEEAKAATELVEKHSDLIEHNDKSVT
ncbi:hypothetical protein GIB67_012809 [Kingdonia uniflora]|uniref:Uncharacterized protein n=1 Tax=Kingdonia uniflora TaxID=39325 RepID=A0A7J7NFZ9_9MAGN|nr:hypothetical protein GIB67_012809 [Kingdonia uniflora]